MSLDHEAIYKAYPNVVRIDEAKGQGPFDKDGKKVDIVQSNVDKARSEIDTAFAAVKYQRDRAAEFPDWQTQLDYIYHHGVAKWKTDIVQPVKDKHPKP